MKQFSKLLTMLSAAFQIAARSSKLMFGVVGNALEDRFPVTLISAKSGLSTTLKLRLLRVKFSTSVCPSSIYNRLPAP